MGCLSFFQSYPTKETPKTILKQSTSNRLKTTVSQNQWKGATYIWRFWTLLESIWTSLWWLSSLHPYQHRSWVTHSDAQVPDPPYETLHCHNIPDFQKSKIILNASIRLLTYSWPAALIISIFPFKKLQNLHAKHYTFTCRSFSPLESESDVSLYTELVSSTSVEARLLFFRGLQESEISLAP